MAAVELVRPSSPLLVISASHRRPYDGAMKTFEAVVEGEA
jgi:hypothetical protein